MSALSKARKAANLTQQQLADLVGLTQAAIGHYENMRRTPGLLECRNIVRALISQGVACTLDDIFPEEEARLDAA